MKTRKAEKEITDKVRCNNCMGIFHEDTEECPKCKTDAYLMQPFIDMPPTPKQTHTPMPWRVESDKDFDRVYGYTAKGSFCVATCNDSNDAHLIVNAVNAHEELLEQLKIWVMAFEDDAEIREGKVYKDSLKAIAKAEGL